MLTQERLRELLHYDPETGVFTWLVYRGPTAKAGQIAGSIKPRRDGKKLIVHLMVEGKLYYAQNLAWFYVHGDLYPRDDLILDHQDGDTLNNRVSNLRPATHGQNMANKRAHYNNKSGFKGVALVRGRYHASINISGKKTFLGSYATGEEASAVYNAAAEKEHGEFVRLK